MPVGLVPSESWACAWTSPDEPAGVVNVNESGKIEPAVIATGAPLKLSVVSGAKSEPVTATSSPPDAGPAPGHNAETVGRATVYLPMNVFQHVLAVAQVVVPVLPSVSADSTQTSVGCDASCTAAEYSPQGQL